MHLSRFLCVKETNIEALFCGLQDFRDQENPHLPMQ